MPLGMKSEEQIPANAMATVTHRQKVTRKQAVLRGPLRWTVGGPAQSSTKSTSGDCRSAGVVVLVWTRRYTQHVASSALRPLVTWEVAGKRVLWVSGVQIQILKWSDSNSNIPTTWLFEVKAFKFILEFSSQFILFCFILFLSYTIIIC